MNGNIELLLSRLNIFDFVSYFFFMKKLYRKFKQKKSCLMIAHRKWSVWIDFVTLTCTLTLNGVFEQSHLMWSQKASMFRFSFFFLSFFLSYFFSRHRHHRGCFRFFFPKMPSIFKKQWENKTSFFLSSKIKLGKESFLAMFLERKYFDNE